MAIEKKIKLYVSDTTGERKVAKYYRIPLVGDSLPYNETTNPLKDVLRVYAKISGDRIMFAAVNSPSLLTQQTFDFSESMESFKINLPEEFLNSGESTVTVTSYANDGNEVIKYSVTKGVTTLNTITKSFIDKESLFTQTNYIISDEYTNLVEVVPSDWIEKDNINEILREITTWRASRNPYIPDLVTEDVIKSCDKISEIQAHFFSDTSTANDPEFKQFYHEYNGGGYIGSESGEFMCGYTIPEGKLVGDELDMIICADPGYEVFVATFAKDGAVNINKYGITQYEYNVNPMGYGGYHVHLTGMSNINKFVIAINQRTFDQAGLVYLNKSQFKFD